MKADWRPSQRDGDRRRRRSFVRLAGVVAAAAIGALGSTGTAGAAITSFGVSPAAGPAGTVVHVSGSGCVPGLLSSSSTDFVTVTVPTLNVTLQAPVKSDGSWQGSFPVPASASAGSAPVVALCVSGGLESLLTIYIPQVFTVTAGSAPPTTTTTVAPPPPTAPVATPVPTTPSAPSGPGPTPATTAPGAPPTTRPGPTPSTAPRSNGHPRRPAGSPPPTTRPGSLTGLPGATAGPAGPSSGTAPAAGGDPTARDVASRSGRRAHRADPATLLPANLGASLVSGSGPAGLGWLGWLLLLALAIAAIATPAWLWRSRQRETPPDPRGETV